MGLRTQLRRLFSPYAYLGRVVKSRCGYKVLSGPFEGMQYVKQATGAAYLPKLLGTYERELTGSIEKVIAGDHDLLVDVGAAEGYFAVGLATRCEAPVVTYEMSPFGRDLAAELAEKNGVAGRIEQHGECVPESLEGALSDAQRPFLLIDVEGAEAQLLDPRAVPSLRRTTILVEIHEFARPGITADLMHRFASTHDVEVIWEAGRSADEYPYSTFLSRLMPKKYLRRAVEEHRGHQQSWLWITPANKNTSQQAA